MKDNNGFWQSEKGKAAIKLGLWMIFIVVLIVIVIISEQGTTNLTDDEVIPPEVDSGENTDFNNYSDMLDNLLLDNYEYSYTITTENGKYIYTGWKNANKEIGFREDGNGIIKYFVDESNTYRINMDTLEVMPDLYNGFDSSYIDLHLLFENLSEYLYSVEKNGNIRTINYDKEGYQVIVTTDIENITNIQITVDTATYDLEFTKVGECATIDFTS